MSAVVAGYTERLIGSGETRNLDSVGELHSRDGSVIAIGDGEGLSEGFGGRGLGWVVLFVSIASRVTRWPGKEKITGSGVKADGEVDGWGSNGDITCNEIRTKST